jgi:transcriptional regulator GlxA family with amidase domain
VRVKPVLQQAERIDVPRLDQWIQAHLANKIEVAQLAELCHLSSSQFQTLFQHKMGLSPYQYVIRKRLDAATWLLQNTHTPIADIALEVGFADQSALTKAFRLYRGITPALIREQAPCQ